jgi:hypothetical protein
MEHLYIEDAEKSVEDWGLRTGDLGPETEDADPVH